MDSMVIKMQVFYGNKSDGLYGNIFGYFIYQ